MRDQPGLQRIADVRHREKKNHFKTETVFLRYYSGFFSWIFSFRRKSSIEIKSFFFQSLVKFSVLSIFLKNSKFVNFLLKLIKTINMTLFRVFSIPFFPPSWLFRRTEKMIRNCFYWNIRWATSPCCVSAKKLSIVLFAIFHLILNLTK